MRTAGFRDADITWDMETGHLEMPAGASARVTTLGPDETRTPRARDCLAFLDRVFPGRWADEAREVLEGTWPGSRVVVLLVGEQTVAFALAHPPGSLWTARWWGRDSGMSALGPLGVDDARRGEGLGRQVVSDGLSWLLSRGATSCTIDWTTLTEFYGAFGLARGTTYLRQRLCLREP